MNNSYPFWLLNLSIHSDFGCFTAQGLCDTGANCNVIARQALTDDFYCKVKTPAIKLDGVGGSTDIVGKFTARVQISGSLFKNLTFLVVNATKVPLIIGQPLWLNETVDSTTFGRDFIEFSRLTAAGKVSEKVPVVLSQSTNFKLPSLNYECCVAVDKAKSTPTSTEAKVAYLKEKYGLVLEHDNEQELRAGADLLIEYEDIFGKATKDFPYEVEIPTRGPPIAKTQNIIPVKHKPIMDDEFNSMLRDGVVEPCDDAKGWRTPIMVVTKSNGKPRWCMNFKRTLNLRLSDEETFSQVPADELFTNLRPGKRYFSNLDLRKGYWQIPLAKSHRFKTAFQWNGSMYQFAKLPFGLRTAGAIFGRAVNRAMNDAEVSSENVLVYLDDISIAAENFADFLDGHRRVFNGLRKYGLRVSPEKCNFFKKSIKFLGRVLDSTGMHPDPQYTQDIVNMEPPRNRAELRSLIGMLSWNRQFIGTKMGRRVAVSSFSHKMAPIFQCARAEKFLWSEEAQKAFNSLKKMLQEAPFISYFDPTKELTLTTDASVHACGGVLMQKYADDDYRVIAVISKTFTAAEARWSTTEREAYAIFWAVKRLNYFLAGNPFVVFTDHRSLVHMDKTVFSNTKVARWQDFLSDYSFTLQYIEGSKNCMADWLSRAPTPVKAPKVDPKSARPAGKFFSISGRNSRGEVLSSKLKVYVPSWVMKDVCDGPSDRPLELTALDSNMSVNYAKVVSFGQSELENGESLLSLCSFMARRQVTDESEVFDHFRVAFRQKQDPFLSKIIDVIKKPVPSNPEERTSTVISVLNPKDGRYSKFKKAAAQLFIDIGSDLLCVKTRFGVKVIVPDCLISAFLHGAHDLLGHAGQPRMESYLDHYYWVGKKADIANWSRSCEECCRRKGNDGQPNCLAGVNRKGTYPWERIFIDYVSMPTSNTGHRAMLTVIDSFSRFLKVYPLKSTTAHDTAKCLVRLVNDVRVIPKVISSDRGLHFHNQLVEKMLAQIGVKQELHTAYRPQSTGILERQHRCLKNAIFITTKQRKCQWTECLESIVSAMNASVNAATKKSPFEVIFGRKGVLGLPVLDQPKGETHAEYLADLNSHLREIQHFVRISNFNADQKYLARINNGTVRQAISPGQKVCLYRPQSAPDSKFCWIGSFTVLESNYNVVKIRNEENGKEQWVHSYHVKPIVTRDSRLEREIDDFYDSLPPVSENRGGGARPSSVSNKAPAKQATESDLKKFFKQKAPKRTRKKPTTTTTAPRRSGRQRKQTQQLNIAGTNTQSYAAIVKLRRQPCPSIQ